MKFIFTALAIFTIIVSMTNQAFARLAIDVSALTSVATFKCTKNLGYERAIIRGYREAYGRNPGGGIDPNFLKNYDNAKNAGYIYIEVYMFPCTGRSTCKTPRQQVNELVQLIKTHRVIVQRVWLDIEVDPNAGNWNLGQVRNRQILKEFHAVWKSTGWKFGIYSNQYQWKTITGNINWILDSSLPLWYAIYDKKPVLNNYRPFGGWTRGTGKQYDGDVKFCGARLDKNVFR
ncbi:hypothetical protein Glove_43g96 [Diversispora epigaea]|uniref:Lysozyme n=1 Tax=Diversispora epigaea TaxID=1348612 RepID=A0A397JEW4_9GLOM|nr:hypothetical protein Glove_43g96 [Diversispora epigaea]